MAFGISIEGSTFNRIIEHTGKIYQMVTSYEVAVTAVNSFPNSDGYPQPRFFRVALPHRDAIVTVCPVTGFGSGTAIGNAQVIGKVWRGPDCEVYVTTDARPIMVAVYAPVFSGIPTLGGYGLKILDAQGYTFSSTNEALFPIGVGNPTSIKDRKYKVPVSAAITTVGSQLRNLIEGWTFYSSEDWANRSYKLLGYFTGVFWKDQFTPQGTCIGVGGVGSSRYYTGRTSVVITEAYHPNEWKEGDVGMSQKLSMGGIMIAKKPGSPLP